MSSTRAGSRKHAPLGPGGEFDVVRAMLARWEDLARGIGDDAAVVPAPAESLVVSVDTSVEDVHFRRAWLSHAEIGYRATAAAISDLAAMAARPIGVFIALTLPEADVEHIEPLADGIGESIRTSETVILGGDVTRGDKLSLTVTVLGAATAPLARSSACTGDRVYVTGHLGGPKAALRALSAGTPPDPRARSRFAHPVPRLREALWLAAHGATAAIDISDGLIADASHVAAASGIALELRREAVPVHGGAEPDDALTSGEEYELLVTAARELDVEAFRAEHDLELTEIGTAVAGPVGQVVLTAGGARVPAPPGFDHFSR